MATMTPEQRRLVEQAGEAPVRIATEESQREYVVLPAEINDRMRHVLEGEQIDPSFFEIGDFEPIDEDPRSVANHQ